MFFYKCIYVYKYNKCRYIVYIMRDLKTILLLKYSLKVVLISVIILVLFIFWSVMPVWLLHSVSSSLLVQFPYGYSN